MDFYSPLDSPAAMDGAHGASPYAMADWASGYAAFNEPPPPAVPARAAGGFYTLELGAVPPDIQAPSQAPRAPAPPPAGESYVLISSSSQPMAPSSAPAMNMQMAMPAMLAHNFASPVQSDASAAARPARRRDPAQALADGERAPAPGPDRSDYATETGGDALHWVRRLEDIMSRSWDVASGAAEVRGLELGALMDEFVARASALAMLVVSELHVPPSLRTLPPLDVGGVAGGLKFARDGVFLKLAADVHGLYGSDDAAFKAVGHEHRGLAAYVDWLCGHRLLIPSGAVKMRFPLSVVVDFAGYRMLAVSQLPIDGAQSLVYGSADGGKSVHADEPGVNAWMAEAAAYLNLQPHRVTPSAPGAGSVELAAPADIEVHRSGAPGSNTYFLLDTHRVMPPARFDARFHNGHLYRQLRPEFVRSYAEPLCSDAYSRWGANPEDPSALPRVNAAIGRATDALETSVVPAFARWWSERASPLSLTHSAAAVQALREFVVQLHSFGVNVRYTAHVRALLTGPHAEAWRAALLVEVLARTLKASLRALMREAIRSPNGAGGDEAGSGTPLLERVSARLLAALWLVFSASPQSHEYWSSKLVPAVAASKYALATPQAAADLAATFRSPVVPVSTPCGDVRKGAVPLSLLFARLQQLVGFCVHCPDGVDLSSPAQLAAACRDSARFLHPADVRVSFEPTTKPFFLAPYAAGYSLHSNSTLARTPGDAGPLVRSTLHVHELRVIAQPAALPSRHACDACGMAVAPGTQRFHCADDNFDLCEACFGSSECVSVAQHEHALCAAKAPGAGGTAAWRCALCRGSSATCYVCERACTAETFCQACVARGRLGGGVMPAGAACGREQRLEAAASLYLRALEVWPLCAQAAVNLCGIVAEQLRDEASPQVQRQRRERYVRLAALALRTVDGTPEIGRAADPFARARILSNLAQFHMASGDAAAARESVDEALACAPTHVSTLLTKASMCDEPREAATYYRRAHEANRSDMRAAALLALFALSPAGRAAAPESVALGLQCLSAALHALAQPQPDVLLLRQPLPTRTSLIETAISEPDVSAADRALALQLAAELTCDGETEATTRNFARFLHTCGCWARVVALLQPRLVALTADKDHVSLFVLADAAERLGMGAVALAGYAALVEVPGWMTRADVARNVGLALARSNDADSARAGEAVLREALDRFAGDDWAVRAELALALVAVLQDSRPAEAWLVLERLLRSVGIALPLPLPVSQAACAPCTCPAEPAARHQLATRAANGDFPLAPDALAAAIATALQLCPHGDFAHELWSLVLRELPDCAGVLLASAAAEPSFAADAGAMMARALALCAHAHPLVLWQARAVEQCAALPERVRVRHLRPALHADVHYACGVAALEAGAPGAAIESFGRALSLVPTHVMALRNAGVAYLRTNAVDRALAVYARAHALDAADGQTADNLALCYEATRRHAAALPLLQQRVEQLRASGESAGPVLLRLCAVHALCGDLAAARECLQAAADEGPSDEPDRFDQRLAVLQQALEAAAEPDSGDEAPDMCK